MGVREPEEYQVGSLIGGLPTCVFSPKMYPRLITNIVVGNSATSVVRCYRQLLGSTPVAQNSLGQNNTMQGTIYIPAGQTFFVQWSAVGVSVRDAFARVSWERVDNPLGEEGGFNEGQEWAENAVTSLQVPSGVDANAAAILVGSDLPVCMQATYSSAVLWRPNGSVSSNRLYYFMAQPRLVITQSVDHGFLWYNGTDCGYVVIQRDEGFFFGPNLIRPIRTYGQVFNSGSVAFSTQPDFRYQNAHMFFDTNSFIEILATARLEAYGDFLSLRNEYATGFGVAASSIGAAAYANYPTTIAGLSIDKVGGALDTDLEIFMSNTFFVSNAGAYPRFAVLVNGVDWLVHHMANTNLALTRLANSGIARVTGLAAGNYTVVPRWQNVTAVGLVQSDASDLITITVKEVAV